jgi:transcriptional regulator NrdR family protein
MYPMNCPACGHPDHRVLRTDAKGGRVRRSRECLKCTQRWHTVEAPESEYQRAQEIAEAFRAMRGAVGEE